MVESDEKIRNEVLSTLENDKQAAEFNLVLFSSALLSYRKSSCLRPCPHIKLNDNDLDELDFLTSTFNTIPPISELQHTTLPQEAWNLLHWICCNKTFSIKSCEKELLKEIKAKTGESSFSLQPDYIFEVFYKNSPDKQKFEDMKEQYGTKYGYHGSRMDNFYSIISNGLQVHMMKNGLYGEGIYLTDDLAVTMPYTKSGTVWTHSQIGSQLSCVALCELIDHPGVKCQVENDVEKKRSTAKNSESGEVPERYYVVTSSELVRVKYILAFADKKPQKRAPSKKKRWVCQDYPVASILCFYVLFLILMGIWRSRSFQAFFRKHFRTDGDEL